MRSRNFGGRVILTPDVGPLLLHPDTRPQEVILLSTTDSVIGVHRHWNDEIRGTEPCRCEPRCPSHRIDRFAAAILRVDAVTYEERVAVISEQGWAELERWCYREDKTSEVRGIHMIWNRTGDKANGRVCIKQASRLKEVPLGFDVAPLIRRHLGIAADFFGSSIDDLQEPQPKPRVPKGRK